MAGSGEVESTVEKPRPCDPDRSPLGHRHPEEPSMTDPTNPTKRALARSAIVHAVCGFSKLISRILQDRIDASLQRLQEIDQILHLLRRESYLKTPVIEIHDLGKVRCRSVMEIRCASGKTAQDRTFGAADIAALS